VIHRQDLFTQFGGGREGFWDEDAWLAVLTTLNNHDGQAYSQSANQQLFDDLEDALRPLNAQRGNNQQLNASGQDESRSVFRAAGDIWVDTNVVKFDDNTIHIMPDGAAVLAGNRTYQDCLRHMFASYREKRNGKSPFIPALRLLTARHSVSFGELFDAIQAECGPEMRDWLNSSKLPGFPYEATASVGNPRRSIRLVLRLLSDAGLIHKGPTPESWEILDPSAAQQIVNAFSQLAQSSTQQDAERELDVPAIVESLHEAGWTFEPWQVAAYCHAVRTKPFVILAGISGTGKTKLPHLIAEATNAEVLLIPVRPDWRDSSDILGYTDLVGKFHVGPLLQIAHTAIANPDKQYFAVLDEMNLARVEHYFAEVLSKIEDRVPSDNGGYRTSPLLTAAMDVRDEDNDGGLPWKGVYLPSNLAVVGSVNMDETTHGFSRKVLDRAFVIEFSEVNLKDYGESPRSLAGVNPHSAEAWRQDALRLSDHPDPDKDVVLQVIEELVAVNDILGKAQLQVGYRVRDEVALFCLEASGSPSMVRSNGDSIDALDLVLCMKILPRIQGGGLRIKSLLAELADWAGPAESPRLPVCYARIGMLQSRLKNDGFTNFWL
jgi:hypothetical protein